MSSVPSILRNWALDQKELPIIASLLYKMMDTDIHLGTDFPDWIGLCPMDVTEHKTVWIGDWENRVRAGLVPLLTEGQLSMYFDTMPEFETMLTGLSSPGNRFRAGMLLVELAAAEGYWPEIVADDYLKGVYISPEVRINILKYTARHLGFPEEFGESLRGRLEEYARDLGRRAALTEPPEFAGWRLGWLTLGVCAPFWRGGLRGSLGAGGSHVSSRDDLIPWSIGHLGAGIILSQEIGIPGPAFPYGAGAGMLLAPGLTHRLPPACHLQPETLVCVAAKFALFVREVVMRLGIEVLARQELVELLSRTHDVYRKALRSEQITRNTQTMINAVDGVFSALIELMGPQTAA
ncbi:MAG TPA: hypothetical protein PLP29_08635 [Candidatus Ozemobacteraceae bacterium]|nr:hypothetical protein [Candidatus Ozemobacteraceae bacterium]